MSTQCYKGHPVYHKTVRHANLRNTTCDSSTSCFKTNSDPFRTKTVVVDENYVSINNKLVGGPNPKTLIPPMITTPAYSLAWRKSDTVVPNMINGHATQDLSRSGYVSQEYAPYLPREYDDLSAGLKQNDQYISRPLNETMMTLDRLGDKNKPVIETYAPVDENPRLPTYGEKDWSNMINTANGYNKSQYENASFPTNNPQGRTGQQAEMSEYNKQLFTQTVQPGVYYREDIIEPVNSNIGISFQQQFLPRTIEDHSGNRMTIDHDPYFAPEPQPRKKAPDAPLPENVYDPRFSGYGTGSRCYIDKVTGQPRYPYDDINAVRMPNYIVRNKIDTHSFSDAYGPVTDTGKSLNEIRPLAQDAFYRDTTQHRNDITTSAMRKMNAAMWQRRQAPLSATKR